MTNLKNQIMNLPERWNDTSSYYSLKSKIEVFDEFKKHWGIDSLTRILAIEEFISISDSVYTQWKIWKRKNGYDNNFKSRYNSKDNSKCNCCYIDEPSKWCDHKVLIKTFTEVWNEFKIFWDLDSEESKIMFKEMELYDTDLHSYSFTQTYIGKLLDENGLEQAKQSLLKL